MEMQDCRLAVVIPRAQPISCIFWGKSFLFLLVFLLRSSNSSDICLYSCYRQLSLLLHIGFQSAYVKPYISFRIFISLVPHPFVVIYQISTAHVAAYLITVLYIFILVFTDNTFDFRIFEITFILLYNFYINFLSYLVFLINDRVHIFNILVSFSIYYV